MWQRLTDMGGYELFVWGAYGITVFGLGLIGYCSWRRLRYLEKLLRLYENQSNIQDQE